MYSRPEQLPLICHHSSEESSRKFKRIALSVTYLIFSTGIDPTITSAAAPTIAEYFGDTSSSLFLPTITLLFSTIAAPMFAQLSNACGTAFACGIASLFFAGGALTCVFAPTLLVVLCGRALAGLGNGGIGILSSVVLSETVPLKSRALWHSVGKLVAGVSMALGGPVGGIVSDKLHWRVAFMLEVPLALVAFLVSVLCLESHATISGGFSTPINRTPPKKEVDIMGCILLPLIIAPIILISSTLATSFGASEATYVDKTVVIISIIVAIASTAVFAFNEHLSTKPIVSVRLLRRKNVGTACLMQLLCASVHHSILSLSPIVAVVIGRTSVSLAGVYIMPISFAAVLATVVAGHRIKRTGRCKSLLLVGALFVILGPLAFMGAISYGEGRGHKIIYALCSFPSTFGFQLISSVSIVVLLAGCDSTEIADITSHASLFKSLGGVMGVSLSAVVMQGLLSYTLSTTLPPQDHQYLLALKSPGQDWSSLPLAVQVVGYDAWKSTLGAIFGILSCISMINVLVTSWGISELDASSLSAGC